jgi:hypothetical protein
MIGWLRAARLRPMKPQRSIVAPRNRRRFALRSVSLGLLLLAILQIALGFAAEESLYLRDPGYEDKAIRLARQEARNPTGPRVVMLGTSRAAAAFDAGSLRNAMGNGVAFNFGIPASGPVTHIIYLKRLLKDGHKPDLLILEVLPPSLADAPGVERGRPTDHVDPLEARFLFGDRLRHSELDDAIGYGFPAESVKRDWRQSVTVPFYSLRFPIMGRLMPSAQPWHLRFDWSRGCDEFGWGAPFAATVTPEEYAAGLERAKHEYRAILADMRPNGGASRALTDIAALCHREGIPLKLVMMPEATGFRAIYPPVVVERIRAFLQGLCREHGCELIDAREWLPDSGFTDGHHVLKSGAAIFTNRLRDEVVMPKLAR